MNGSLFPEWKKTIAREEIPLVVLGDPAYPLLPWVMKPYVDNGYLSRDQRRLNYHLSRARVVVEDAYGQLKGRWRCLSKRNDTDISDLPDLIACFTTCVRFTENSLMRNGFKMSTHVALNTASNHLSEVFYDSNASYGSAENIRKALTAYFKDN